MRNDSWDYGPLYAAWARAYRDDLRHYGRLARKERARGPILELGCGTGRILEVLCEEGDVSVVGVDSSMSQLATAASSPKLAEARRRGALALACGDMARFHWNARFGAVILGYNSFAYLVDDSARVECVRGIRGHLSPGGVLAMDLDNPQVIEAAPEGVFGLDQSLEDHPAPGFQTRVYIAYERHPRRPVENIRYRVVTTGPDGFVSADEIHHDMFSASRGEIETLLEQVGFEDVRIWGGFDRTPFDPDESPLLVVEAR